MISFLIMLCVVWMVARFVGVLSCPAPRGRWALHGWDRDQARDANQARDAKRPMPGGRAALASPAARVETPLEKLQREFADGTITVEQYEHEVGKLYGVRDEPMNGPA